MGSLIETPGPKLDFTRRTRVAEHAPAGSGEKDGRLRFAVATMVSAEETFSAYRRLVGKICRDVGREEAFIVRPSYAAVRTALEKDEVDVAFVCTGTYVHSRSKGRIELLVQPEFLDDLEYRCVVIVRSQSPHKTLADLRGQVMAFTDPESNTGCLVPSATLVNRGFSPQSFFRKIIFTGSHDRSILAVAVGAVDVAAVDALIWRSAIRRDPSLTQRVRVIWQSEEFGPPPIVVPKSLPRDLADALRDALLALDKDQEGKDILKEIGIRRFVPAQPEHYQSAIELHERMQQQGD
jgi:phosphonate transport system substrate-binding protein